MTKSVPINGEEITRRTDLLDRLLREAIDKAAEGLDRTNRGALVMTCLSNAIGRELFEQEPRLDPSDIGQVMALGQLATNVASDVANKALELARERRIGGRQPANAKPI